MAALDAEMIIFATEDVLRRHGPSKATVVDVARVLGVSHAAVYRHFSSKAALREAVIWHWLTANQGDLIKIAADTDIPPPQRLRQWLHELFRVKRERAVEDPELFATFSTVISESAEAATRYRGHLLTHLDTIMECGFETGDFHGFDPSTASRTVFEATMAFHSPFHVTRGDYAERAARLDEVCTLILQGLAPRD